MRAVPPYIAMISRLRDDERGIALQTIIILVVLLAIAGAVAAVILTRAGTETDRLEQETDRWTGITNETGCEIAGGAWSNPGNPGSCGTPGTAIHISSTKSRSYCGGLPHHPEAATTIATPLLRGSTTVRPRGT